MTQAAVVEAMQRPDFYPHRPSDVTLVQTHISYVFLAGDQVYKVKKAVQFSFLDFSTLELRRHFCHEEVRLNRRLARDVYLGVVAICRRDGCHSLAAESDSLAVEYAVHMRRLPAQRMLDRLLDDGQVTTGMIDEIAQRLAAFHRQADAGPEVTANGDTAAIWRILDDNFTGARRFRDITIPAANDDLIQKRCRAFLDRNRELFRRRQRQHRIRDGHGDLHSEHLCVCGDGLVIYDCIEFNPSFRYCDVASEIAFLAMDLDYHDHPELARYLVARYANLAGDEDLTRLAPFYQCHRAYVRGKVDSLKSAEPEVDEADRVAARASAERHFRLACQYSWSFTPILVAVCGLSGSGKSTLASVLHANTGYRHLSSDVVRKQLFAAAEGRRGTSGYGSGLYTAEHDNATYRKMFEIADQEVRAGRGAILDATFQRRADRDALRAGARSSGVPLLLVECRCGDEEVRRRLARRTAQGGGASDADWGVYREQQRRYDAFGPDEDADHLVCDTALPASETSRIVEDALRARTDQ